MLTMARQTSRQWWDFSQTLQRGASVFRARWRYPAVGLHTCWLRRPRPFRLGLHWSRFILASSGQLDGLSSRTLHHELHIGALEHLCSTMVRSYSCDRR